MFRVIPDGIRAGVFDGTLEGISERRIKSERTFEGILEAILVKVSEGVFLEKELKHFLEKLLNF